MEQELTNTYSYYLSFLYSVQMKEKSTAEELCELCFLFLTWKLQISSTLSMLQIDRLITFLMSHQFLLSSHQARK